MIQAPPSKWMTAYLLLTAVLCGALIMVIEVLGSRVISPFFGVSLFVWTSLITVTLVCLSLGYAVGGLMSDRKGTTDYLFLIILFAGLLVLAIPSLKDSVLKISAPLGLRIGSLVATTLLFGPSLFLLGCVSPYLIRIATTKLQHLGRMVGGIYALSTLGSVIGTVLTGFVLIAYLSVDRIFYFVGAALVCIAIGYYAFLRGPWFILVLLALPLFYNRGDSTVTLSRVMDNGTRVTLIAARDSFYGSVKVVDYSYHNHHTRELIIDGLIQGGIDLQNGLSVYEYAYFLQYLPVNLNPEGNNCLVIGLGAGVIPKWYDAQGIETDVVDINPIVFDYAERFFSYEPSGEIYVEDARYFLHSHPKQYDYMILDVFSGDITPAHLLSVEAVALMKARLRSSGVLGVNLVGSLRNNTLMTASVYKTFKSVFDQVEIYPTYDPNEGDGRGNIALIAYSGPSRSLDYRTLQNIEVHRLARARVSDNLVRHLQFNDDVPAILLTDDYNPIDLFDVRLREMVREDILESTEWDILSH